MIFLSGLKRLCDICFYLTFASFLGVAFGGTNLLITLPIFGLVAFLAASLASKGKLRYAPLGLLVICFIIVPLNFMNVTVLIPPCLYLIYTLPKPNEDIGNYDYTGPFKLFLKIYLIMIPLFLAFGWRSLLEDSALPFGLLFLLSTTIFLRMVRHEEQILNQHRVKLINLLAVIGLGVSSLILSSNPALNLVGILLGGLYFNLLLPILLVLFAGVVFLLGPVLNLFADQLDPIIARMGFFMQGPPNLMEGGGFEELMPEEAFTTSFFVYAIYIAAALLVVLVVIKLFKKLAPDNFAIEKRSGLTETRTAIQTGKKSPRIGRRTPNHQIREIYRKFLQKCHDEGITIKPFMTSLDIEHKAADYFQSPHTKKLRDMYIKVRYGEINCDKEDVKQIKALYKELNREGSKLEKRV